MCSLNLPMLMMLDPEQRGRRLDVAHKGSEANA